MHHQNDPREAVAAWEQAAGPAAPPTLPRVAVGIDVPPGQRVRLVRAIERAVLPRLILQLRPEGSVGSLAATPLLAAEELERFLQHVIDGDDAQIAAGIDALRSRGMPVEAILLELLVPAARRLGALWEDDRCDFPAVTVGVGRLQRLMHALSSSSRAPEESLPSDRRILLMQPEAEQHIFGLSMVAEFFRRAGWSVDGGVAGSRVDPAAAVRREWFDVVGVSVGSDKHADGVAQCIADVRRASRNRAVVVLAGGPLLSVRPERCAQFGADALVTDASQATAIAEALLAERLGSVVVSTRPG